jgi:hypothetical protein
MAFEAPQHVGTLVPPEGQASEGPLLNVEVWVDRTFGETFFDVRMAFTEIQGVAVMVLIDADGDYRHFPIGQMYRWYSTKVQ